MPTAQGLWPKWRGMIYFLPSVLCLKSLHYAPLPSLLLGSPLSYPLTLTLPLPLLPIYPPSLAITLHIPSPSLSPLSSPSLAIPLYIPPPTQWEANHAQLVQQGTRVMNILQEAMSASGGSAHELPRPQCIEKACATLVSRFDKKYGGFGSAPKFPQPCEV